MSKVWNGRFYVPANPEDVFRNHKVKPFDNKIWVATNAKGVVTMTNKMTYAQAVRRAIEGTITPEVITKLEALEAQLQKKATAERKPTAKQTANAKVRATLVNFINQNSEGHGFTVTELIKHCPEVKDKDYSNQYVSAILRQAVQAGEISKGSVKRRTYFAPIGTYEMEEGA